MNANLAIVFIHEEFSVVEWTAVIVVALLFLAVVIAVISNLGGLRRYLRIKQM